jgi:23S rRNA (cytosine1962-C5)-methyltransferase
VAVVNARGRARVLARHPWIFRQDVVSGPDTDARDGGPALVRVLGPRGEPLALASWAARAKVALRVFAVGPQAAEEAGERSGEGAGDLSALVVARLGAALARRGGLERERDAFRIVHGEGDGLPGLFVDRFADALVMQTTSVAMDAAEAQLAPWLQQRLGARLVVARDDGSARDFEELPRRSGLLAGEGPSRVVYRLGPNELETDLLSDGKTGGFLDQADNHAQVAALAPRGARALDAFTHHGGFALALARRGGAVLATDDDPTAVERARANAARNDLANLEVRRANAFDLLRQLESDRARFDVVVVDPPALAKRKSEVARPSAPTRNWCCARCGSPKPAASPSPAPARDASAGPLGRAGGRGRRRRRPPGTSVGPTGRRARPPRTGGRP